MAWLKCEAPLKLNLQNLDPKKKPRTRGRGFRRVFRDLRPIAQYLATTGPPQLKR
jgi:hypothetical protein